MWQHATRDVASQHSKQSIICALCSAAAKAQAGPLYSEEAWIGRPGGRTHEAVLTRPPPRPALHDHGVVGHHRRARSRSTWPMMASLWVAELRVLGGGARRDRPPERPSRVCLLLPTVRAAPGSPRCERPQWVLAQGQERSQRRGGCCCGREGQPCLSRRVAELLGYGV
eukprot:scaffold3859_cov122-Isochrysis_galbana.AAC.4